MQYIHTYMHTHTHTHTERERERERERMCVSECESTANGDAYESDVFSTPVRSTRDVCVQRRVWESA